MESSRRKTIAVIGDGNLDPCDERYKLAFESGKILVDNGYRVQTGGLGGVMEAAMRGAKSSEHYREGDTVAIIPSFDKGDASEYADIVIPTGLDVMRNALVANSDAVVAIGGGAGTLSEMALAWTLKRLVVAYKNVPGWSSKLAGEKIDKRVRYKEFDEQDVVFAVKSADEMIEAINANIEKYDKWHKKIKRLMGEGKGEVNR